MIALRQCFFPCVWVACSRNPFPRFLDNYTKKKSGKIFFLQKRSFRKDGRTEGNPIDRRCARAGERVNRVRARNRAMGE